MGSRHWLTGLLDEEDFLLLYPHYRSLLPGLLELYQRQRKFLEIRRLGCEVELLQTFIDTNSKEIFGVELDDLCIPMTVECISHQAKATTVKLRGFERVFPLKWLSIFACREFMHLVSGQLVDTPWSIDELKSNINFSGFDEDSKTVEYLLGVLSGFNVEDRRKFLRFVPGFSTLPTDGWRNLSLKLKVVKPANGSGNKYPFAQACFHKLYPREYTALQELRDHLVVAISQMNFLIE
nr:ubiquitin protein ligase upl,ubiquitin protein ligase hectd [Hymenolepis microstoma]